MEDGNTEGDKQKQHPFGFPFEPYPIQVELMQAIYDSAEQGKIAIMESPTGTGKSLSTICAALSWLEAHERRQRDEIEGGIRRLSLAIEETAKDPDWLNVHKKKLEAEQKLEEIREEEAQLRRIEERLEKARRRQKESKQSFGKSRTGKRRIHGGEEGSNEQENILESAKIEGQNKEDVDLIPSDKEELEDDPLTREFTPEKGVDEEEKQAPPSCIKLIYASRTHSQLEQFLNELAKTQFHPRVLTLGSRQQLCVNDAVRELGQVGLVNDRCNELLSGITTKTVESKRAKLENGKVSTSKTKKCGCQFAHPEAIEDLSDAILTANETTQEDDGHSQGIKGIVSLGKERHACPYFATKSALGLSQLVLVPYNILLHSGMRQTWQLDLRGNVVLIDEAHNLLETLASIHSVELSASQLESCCQCLQDYMERFRARLSPRNLRNVRQLHNLSLSFHRLLTSSAETSAVLTLPQFMIKVGDSVNIDLFSLLTYLDESKLCKKLRDFRLRYQTNTALNEQMTHQQKHVLTGNNCQKKVPQPPISSSSTPLYQLRGFIEAITTRAEDARVLVDRSNPNSPRFRFILLNPAEKLREIVAECRSLILLGGTMRPVEQLMDAFRRVCGVPEQRILEFTCGHVVGPEQLIAISLGKGPDQTPLNLQFANRQSDQLLRSMAQTIANLIRHIPNGAVAFFPSYSFLDTFVQSVRASGHFAQFEKLKTVFIETRAGQQQQQEDIWPLFCAAAKTTRGALLMAVVGGKMSEGINFSDELGRCVFMIGLPYPNRNSPELQERLRRNVDPGAGNRLYEQLCLQQLNQAIGRAIRHRHDHAAIVLLDQRFAKPSVENGLPGWIRQRLKQANTFPEALSALISFFRSHRTQQQPK